MKKVINCIPSSLVDIHHLQEGSIVVYHCKKDNGDKSMSYCMLAKIGSDPYEKYGFVPLNDSNSNPRFTGHSWRACINLALTAGRDVFVFDNMDQMLKAVYQKVF
jgi:hypothetical protein